MNSTLLAIALLATSAPVDNAPHDVKERYRQRMIAAERLPLIQARAAARAAARRSQVRAERDAATFDPYVAAAQAWAASH